MRTHKYLLLCAVLGGCENIAAFSAGVPVDDPRDLSEQVEQPLESSSSQAESVATTTEVK